MTKNPAAVAMGKLGGAAKSEKKTLAARRNIAKRWNMSKSLKEHQAKIKADNIIKILPITSKPEPIKKKEQSPLNPGETALSSY